MHEITTSTIAALSPSEYNKACPQDIRHWIEESVRRMLAGMNLDNGTAFYSEMLCRNGETSMAKDRIKRRVNIRGEQRWITGATEQEYADNLMKAMGEYTQAKSAEKHLFQPYAIDWFEVFSKPTISTTCKNTYERQLRLYILPAFDGMCIEDITAADVQRMFNNMDNHGKKLATASKTKCKNVLNMIFQHAVEEGIIPRNPLASKSIKIKGKPSLRTEPYSVEQMRYIVSHLADIIKPKDRLFTALMALHPLRLEEALGLRWQDIDLDENLIHIRCTVVHPDRNQGVFQELTKTEASRRTIRMLPQLKAFMIPGAPNEFVIGGKRMQSYQLVRDMCRRIRTDIQFPESITPRRFRTTVLTDIYDTTKDIKQTQAAAGHTTASMTLKHYVKGREQSSDTATPIANVYGLGQVM